MACKYPGETETTTALIKLLFILLLYAIEQCKGFTHIYVYITLSVLFFLSVLHLATENDLHVLWL